MQARRGLTIHYAASISTPYRSGHSSLEKTHADGCSICFIYRICAFTASLHLLRLCIDACSLRVFDIAVYEHRTVSVRHKRIVILSLR